MTKKQNCVPVYTNMHAVSNAVTNENQWQNEIIFL